jgi:hypothetical protein
MQGSITPRKLLAKGQIAVDPDQSELAQPDVSPYRTIRLSADNWVGSALGFLRRFKGEPTQVATGAAAARLGASRPR